MKNLAGLLCMKWTLDFLSAYRAGLFDRRKLLAAKNHVPHTLAMYIFFKCDSFFLSLDTIEVLYLVYIYKLLCK